MSNLEETKSNSTEYSDELTEESLEDDEIESTQKSDENVENFNKSRSNVCYYLCFERNANMIDPWYKRNLCMRATYDVTRFLLCLVAMTFVFVILFLFLGWINDLIFHQSNCSVSTGSWSQCISGGIMTTLFYCFNAVSNLIEIGPIATVLYFGIFWFERPYIRWGLFTTLTIILSLCPIFLNILLGWMAVTIFPNRFSNSECVVGNLTASFGTCFLYGVIPIGFSIGGASVVILGIIYLVRFLVDCFRRLKKEQITTQKINV